MKLAMLEDDAGFAVLLDHWLQADGHATKIYSSGTALLRDLRTTTFDLFLLDWNLPDISGIDVMTQMRRRLAISAPILFMTGRDSEDEVAQALTAGADDYMVKPLRERELLARIHALARRSQVPVAPVDLRIGRYRVDQSSHRILLDEQPVALSGSEYELCLYFFRHRNALVSRGQIFMEVFGQSAALATSSRAVDTHVSNLRKKLRLGEETGLRLASVHNIGYRLESLQN